MRLPKKGNSNPNCYPEVFHISDIFLTIYRYRDFSSLVMKVNDMINVGDNQATLGDY
jgi:hypothetical protein